MTTRTAALLAALLALPAGAPAMAAEAASPAPRSAHTAIPAYRPMDEALQRRLDASSARIAALSEAMRAAIGDAAAYARLRAEHDAEVLSYQEASRAAYAPRVLPSP
ncbi:MAG TPA: hypothetical protein VEB20_06165 [Azospirillaceae bacterium]|nr:hypothetical protein [Azospirillaceae bacterium]